jgi:hypothetical protein
VKLHLDAFPPGFGHGKSADAYQRMEFWITA